MLWLIAFLLERCSKFGGRCWGIPRGIFGCQACSWFVENINHAFEIVDDHSLSDAETNVNVRENYLTSLLRYLLLCYWHLRECLQSRCASQCTLMNSLVLSLMNHILAARLLYHPSCYLWIILSLSLLSRQLRKITWCFHMDSNKIHRICWFKKRREEKAAVHWHLQTSDFILSHAFCVFMYVHTQFEFILL